MGSYGMNKEEIETWRIRHDILMDIISDVEETIASGDIHDCMTEDTIGKLSMLLSDLTCHNSMPLLSVETCESEGHKEGKNNYCGCKLKCFFQKRVLRLRIYVLIAVLIGILITVLIVKLSLKDI